MVRNNSIGSDHSSLYSMGSEISRAPSAQHSEHSFESTRSKTRQFFDKAGRKLNNLGFSSASRRNSQSPSPQASFHGQNFSGVTTGARAQGGPPPLPPRGYARPAAAPPLPSRGGQGTTRYGAPYSPAPSYNPQYGNPQYGGAYTPLPQSGPHDQYQGYQNQGYQNQGYQNQGYYGQGAHTSGAGSAANYGPAPTHYTPPQYLADYSPGFAQPAPQMQQGYAPQYGQPQYGQPQYGQPQYGQPGIPGGVDPALQQSLNQINRMNKLNLGITAGSALLGVGTTMFAMHEMGDAINGTANAGNGLFGGFFS